MLRIHHNNISYKYAKHAILLELKINSLSLSLYVSWMMVSRISSMFYKCVDLHKYAISILVYPCVLKLGNGKTIYIW